MVRTGRSLAPWIALTLACLMIGSCCTAAKASKVVLVSIDNSIQPASGGPDVKPTKPTIRKSKKERLLWVSPPGSKLNQILITIPAGSVPPFQKCVVSGSTCQISCDPDGVCVSGPIHDSWAPPPPGAPDFYYEYTATFAVAPIADPGFIIQP